MSTDPPRPSAKSEVQRVRRLSPTIRRKLTVLTVYCETGRCAIAWIYRLRAGTLLDCPGAELGLPIRDVANERWLRREGGQPPTSPARKEWRHTSRASRRAVWLDDDEYTRADFVFFTCDCNHAKHRTLPFSFITRAIADGRKTVGFSSTSGDVAD
jgi:hypothetical protein